MILEEILSLCNRKNVIFVILCAIVIYVHLIAKSKESTKCQADKCIGGKESRCREDEALWFLLVL